MGRCRWTREAEFQSRSRRYYAFTLVELLIVVIILGILAAIALPMFNNASGDAKQSALLKQLELVRKQIQVYRMEHKGAAPSLAQFSTQMTGKTNTDGSTGGTPKLGPYLNKVPINPFTDLSDLGAGGVGTSSWYYNETTGEFKANCHDAHALL